MPRYRMTMFFEQSGFGWSETYYTPNATGTQAAFKVQKMLDLRKEMLPPTVGIVGVRLADESFQRRSIFLVPRSGHQWPTNGVTLNVPGAGSFTVTGERDQDQVRAALQYRVQFDTDRSTTRYIATIPDLLSKTEFNSLDFAAVPEWSKKLNLFYTELQSGGWLVRARKFTGDFAVKNVLTWRYKESTTGVIGVEVENTDALNVKAGDRVHIRNVRRTKTSRQGSMNGVWVVHSVVPGSTGVPQQIYLRTSEGLSPSDMKDPGKIQKVGFDLFPIEAATSVRLGIHKRGKPSLTPRGRRLTRLFLDP